MPIASLLNLALPSAGDADLLRAALHPDGASALARWSAANGDTVEALMGRGALRRRIAPLLRPAAEALGGPLAVRARAADLYETERSAAFDAAAAQTLTALANVAPILLSRGQLLAVSAYPASHLRHRHDLDVMLPHGALADAARALVGAGHRPVAHGPRRIALTHQSGLPVVLHARAHDAFALDLWSGAEPVQAYGQAVMAPSPEALLVHGVLVAAASSTRSSLLWAADAWFAARWRTPDEGRLLQLLRGAPFAPTAAHSLAWLARELAVPIPGQSALERLVEAASIDDLQAALFALRPTVRLRNAWTAADDPATRRALMRWMLAPSTRALVASGRVEPGRSSLPWRVSRPLSALARRLPRPR